jgi:hypothetical protein
LLTEFLKSTIPCEVLESTEYEGIDDTLLISIPNSGEKDGLVLLEKGKAFCFSLPGCSGLWLEGNKLYVSVMSASCMNLLIYEPGKLVQTIISSKLGDIHDVRMIDDQLYVVSTGTNEVAIVDMTGRVRERWPMHGYGDSCHINCLDVWDGRLVATAFGKFTTYRGYKGRTQGSGILYDVKTHETLFDGYSAPHTPRRDENGAVYVCDSRGEGVSYHNKDEKKMISFPGTFPRGMEITKDKIYVGLSSLRHRADTKDGDECIPSAQLAVVDRKTFATLKRVSLPQAEIYDVLAVNN